jgi:photosystem II stability/assembly factor-like uncharacterized protein
MAVSVSFSLPGVSPRAAHGYSVAVTAPRAFAALSFDVFNGGDVWAGNGGGIWRSDDGGAHWHDITPANLVGDDAAVRLTGFGWYGDRSLWFSATEAGNVTKQHLRGFAIERSDDGGLTWRWTARPSCAGCAMAFSFSDARHGFALGDDGALYATTDAGASWSLVTSGLPRSASPAVDFVNREVGWLSAGQLLEQTTDGARTWSPVALAPAGSSGTAPVELAGLHFFSGADGVVAASLPGGRGVVYTTSDGGQRWRAAPLPEAPNAASPGWFTAPSFQASSPTTWSLTSGRRLYMTADAGRSWAEVPTPPTYGKGNPIWGFAMTSATNGWLVAATTPCGGSAQDLCAVPVLLRTTDRGKTWRMVGSSASAAPIGFATGQRLCTSVPGANRGRRWAREQG